MSATDDFLSWFGTLDEQDLSPFADGAEDTGSGPRPLEVLLWRLTHSLVHGKNAQPYLPGPFDDFADSVKYISLPLHSHVKEVLEEKKQAWIDCFPLFFGSGAEPADSAARYRTLYQALPEIGFTFSGFAGNDDKRLKTVPRFLAVTLETKTTRKDKLDFTMSGDGNLFIHATMPPLSEPIRLVKRGLPSDFFPDNRGFAPRTSGTGDREFRESVQRWWKSWKDAVESTKKTIDKRTVPVLKRHATEVVHSLLPMAKRALRARVATTNPALVKKRAEELLGFLAWNHALGFSRILHIPFAGPNPAKGADLVSWGGLVVVLADDVDIDAALGHSQPSPSGTATVSEIATMANVLRAFVDLAVSRVVFGAWADYARDIVRPHQIQTASAAIMSRNLSHNIGSHALASSHLFDAIGVINLQSSAPDEEADQDQARHQSVPDGRFTRFITKGEVSRARERLGFLNTYLQSRMDFIARALGESSSQPEPIFFVNDLLRGFLSQSVLLNTLLADQDFTCENIEFRVWLPDSIEPLTFRRRDGADRELRHASIELDLATSFDDVLVGIPGGMIGRHAFYAFLENLMRNATKYGPRASQADQGSRQRLVIDLHLDERLAPSTQSKAKRDLHCYQLTVTDSLSPDCRFKPNGKPTDQGKITQEIRGMLDEEIIEDTGKAQTRGHGIQEMKICAQFLAGRLRDGAEVMFHSDSQLKEIADNGNEPAGDGPYLEYLKQLPSGEPVDDRRVSLRAFSVPYESSTAAGLPHLAYSLILRRPVLLGIVDTNRGSGPFAFTPTVAFYKSIQALVQGPAYFGLIVADDCRDRSLKLTLDEISKHHTELPFRLMIAVDTPEKAEACSEAIEKFQRRKSAEWWQLEKGKSAFPLPPRRLHVICSPELVSASRNSDVTAEQWQRMSCDVYKLWLDAFKGGELRNAYGNGRSERWHLFIGFQRDRDAVARKWGLADAKETSDLLGDSNICVHLYANGAPVATLGGLSEDGVSPDGRPSCPRATLVLDNHGKVFKFVGDGLNSTESVAAYHQFGIAQLTLFELLYNPPSKATTRVFMLYSVVEALLTRVYMIDERVADATVKSGRVSKAEIGRMQAARLYPLYSVCFAPQQKQRFYLLKGRATARESVPRSEGLYLSRNRNSESVRAISPFFSANAASVGDPPPPDCIVIHEGVADEMKNDKEVPWETGDEHQLHSICPWVVRTSGRGSRARTLGDKLPFLEFSELSDTTYRHMNKVDLGRQLLSLRGLLPSTGDGEQ